MKKIHTDGVVTFTPPSRNAWRRWLEQNHESERCVWLVYKKGAADKANISYVEAVEEALCFGWIDSTSKRLDDSIRIQYFSRRNPRSTWSSLNKQRVAKLSKAKLMHPAGLAMVSLAKKTGTWNALDEVDSLTIPPDLKLEFGRFPAAWANFDAFPKSAKKGILAWIKSARKQETRVKRIERTIAYAAENKRAFP
jgi:uncharacterized protein YdeI (YjbR/CyaY-like superfamily)